MLVKVSNATKIFNTQVVLDDINFEVKEKEIIGIIGRNGCGKSTLLKVIAEEMHLDKGKVHKARNTTIGFLRQDVFSSVNNSVGAEFELIFENINNLKKQIEALSHQLTNEENMLEYSKKLQRFEEIGGYTYHSEIKTIFTKFGFEESELKKQICEFSGGQKTKLALVKLLLLKPDVLLLDEPTNHLDLKTIEWLETYLKNYPKSIVLVSHDRAFLNNVCNGLYEIEYGKIEYYPGNYDYFIEEKIKRKNRQHSLFVKQQEEIERLENLIERFRFKKSKASFVKSKIKYLDRMEKIDDSKQSQKVFKAQFSSRVRSGNKVLETDNLKIGYDKVLANIDVTIHRQDSVAILGENGIGKSTLLKTLIGEVSPLGGDFLFGHHVEVGYFDQDFASLNNENTVLEEIWNEFSDLSQQEVRSALGTFLFTQDEVFKKLNVLSLGEKVRLSLLKLMLLQPNVLLLDEPTNHLDIPTKEALEQALLNYDGTIIFVSHDRYFINKMANTILLMQKENCVVTTLDKMHLHQEEVKKTVLKTPQPQNIGKQLKKIEQKIDKLENNIDVLKALQFKEEVYLDYEKMHEIETQIKTLESELEEAYLEWENLN